MHVLQHIAIQINNYPDEIVSLDECKEEAHNTVKGIFEGMYSESEGLGGWSDWYVVGGGRWNDNTDGYSDNDYSMTISYDQEPEKFLETINRSIESRKIEFNGYRKRFEDNKVDINAKLDSYDGFTEYSFDLYEIGKCIDMLQGKWDMNSYFFDVTNYSTNPKFMLESIDKGNKNWYIVPVDFHF